LADREVESDKAKTVQQATVNRCLYGHKAHVQKKLLIETNKEQSGHGCLSGLRLPQSGPGS
jgi:hypothetical protein